MGKSLKGKELGKGISQRKDGLYQARYTNRFGKRETLYAPKYNMIVQMLRKAQYEDEKEINVVTKDMTLDEFFEVWMSTCKQNCRDSSKETYKTQYNRIKDDLGWRKLNNLNLIVLQKTFNNLCSDNARKDSKKLLVGILDRAIDSNLLTNNPAKNINTIITKEETQERIALTVKQQEVFLNKAKGSFYYNLYALALETGMRLGELAGLQWDDINLKKRIINVRHTMVYYSKNGKYTFELHDTKTKRGKRIIPLTTAAIEALRRQRIQKQQIILKGKVCEEYPNLVFCTKNNKPTQQFLVQQCMKLIVKHLQKDGVDIEEFAPHTLRHTFATRAIENGMQPKTLSKILGHSQLQLTMDLYCHVTDDTLHSEMQKMEQKVV